MELRTQHGGLGLSKTFLVFCTLSIALIVCIALVGVKEWLEGTIDAAVVRSLPPRTIKEACQEIVLQEAGQFVLAHMIKTPSFPTKFALLDHSVRAVPPQLKGLYCEFGVYRGETINFIAARTAGEVHGFDSFEGLPELWREGFEKGMFATAELPAVAANVRLHKGWFNESLPGWLRKHLGPIAFLHMDADLYSSTKCVFDLLADRIVPGTVIQFDEFFNYPGWKEGEYRAFTELVCARELQFEYIGYNPNHEQVAVRITAVGARATGAPQ